MKRLTSFSLAEVDLGIYSDEVRFDVRPFHEGRPYPLKLICETGMANQNLAVEFGDQNWGTHKNVIQQISASPDAFEIEFAGSTPPVPWLGVKVLFDWSRIEHGKDLILATLKWMCVRGDINYIEAPS